MAEHFNCSIIGADSRQIYKRLDIGTAKPSRDEMKKIPHYMIDIIEITDEFTAVRFSQLAKDYIELIFNSGRIPLIVGGAGLYLEAMTLGIVEAPAKDSSVREKLEDRIEREGTTTLHDELKNIDPCSAEKIAPNDPVRIVRALEIFELSGEIPSLLKEHGEYAVPDCDFLWIGLDQPRDELYRRINLRVDAMLTDGLMEEVRSLENDGVGEALRKKKIVGYSEILDVFDGKSTMEEAINLIKQHTRNYAKRQLTWFRNRNSPIWINPLENGFKNKVYSIIDEYLKRT